MKLVVNASPLILLTAARQLEILRLLAERVVVPSAVIDELEAGEELDTAAAQVKEKEWISVGMPLAVEPMLAAWDLGKGETAVLAWRAKEADFTCVLDDRAARNCARVLSFPCVGTLGLVLAAKEEGLIPAARPVLEEMIGAGFYLAGGVLAEALRTVGE